MKKKQKYLTAGVTILAAVATAHLMQRGSNGGPGMAALGPAEASSVMTMPTKAHDVVTAVTVVSTPEIAVPLVEPSSAGSESADVTYIASFVEPDAPVEPSVADLHALPRPPKEAVMPAPLRQMGPGLQSRMSSLASTETEPAAPPVVESARNEFGLSCGVLLTASTRDAAMVSLTLTDPCRSDQRFTLRHGKLTYTAKLDHLGTYMAAIPALASKAVFLVNFDDGIRAEATAEVPMADEIDRVAVFSEQGTGLQIHALEFGADYDQSGHVWSGNPRNPGDAAKIGGGFVTVLGDSTLPDGQMAEVYTFPANTKQREGVVRLSIETEVTAYNCGKDISGQTLQRGMDGAMSPVTLTLAMPDCDAIGEFLVLKNLLRDLKVASN